MSIHEITARLHELTAAIANDVDTFVDEPAAFDASEYFESVASAAHEAKALTDRLLAGAGGQGAIAAYTPPRGDTEDRVTVADGKYTVINDKGRLSALRHGEPWGRDLLGDNLVYWMMVEIAQLRAALADATKNGGAQ